MVSHPTRALLDQVVQACLCVLCGLLTVCLGLRFYGDTQFMAWCP